MARISKKPRRTWKERLKLILLQRDSPQSIARGVALGVWIAFTPTLGLQVVLTLALAGLFRANRLAALPPLLITNALTAGPIYGFECALGARLTPGIREATIHARWQQLHNLASQRGFFAYLEHWKELARLGWDLWLAMWVGGLIVGTLAALIAYPLSLAAAQRIRERRTARLRSK